MREPTDDEIEARETRNEAALGLSDRRGPRPTPVTNMHRYKHPELVETQTDWRWYRKQVHTTRL